MKICLLGLNNLSVLAPAREDSLVGGEPVQQTLLAKALARRGHDVSMIVADLGQADGMQYGGIRTFKAYRPEAGVPVLRFIHPRWTALWSALARADADLYYTSCAGMEVGLLAMFCRHFGKRFVFRCASDADCDKSRLLVSHARDRWLYAHGLRRADAILVQSASQADTLMRSYRLSGRVAGMLVEPAQAPSVHDLDVLWVGNIYRLKRPDRVIWLAARLPRVAFHMVGGAVPGEEALHARIRDAAGQYPNLTFHGRLSYPDANRLFGRAKLLLNTSDVEGFPNTYLQAWIRGVPVVTLIDPDRVIERERLGVAVRSPARLVGAIASLLGSPQAWQSASDHCRRFMAREFGEDRILSAYLDTFARIMDAGRRDLVATPSSEVPDV
ncbi:MAG TPA: glycosyltransferase family 4 protein [Burkholderiales bacterium]